MRDRKGKGRLPSDHRCRDSCWTYVLVGTAGQPGLHESVQIGERGRPARAREVRVRVPTEPVLEKHKKVPDADGAGVVIVRGTEVDDPGLNPAHAVAANEEDAVADRSEL